MQSRFEIMTEVSERFFFVGAEAFDVFVNLPEFGVLLEVDIFYRKVSSSHGVLLWRYIARWCHIVVGVVIVTHTTPFFGGQDTLDFEVIGYGG